jgi:hypothetical protein
MIGHGAWGIGHGAGGQGRGGSRGAGGLLECGGGGKLPMPNAMMPNAMMR